MTKIIELNGRIYEEADHGRFDVSLLDNGEEIARTSGDEVIWFRGKREDIELWANSYDIEKISYHI